MTTTAESPAAKGGAPEIEALAGTGSDINDTDVSADSSSTDALDALDAEFEAQLDAEDAATTSFMEWAEDAQADAHQQRLIAELTRVGEVSIPRVPSPSGKPYRASVETIRTAVRDAFLHVDRVDLVKSCPPAQVAGALLGLISDYAEAENLGVKKGVLAQVGSVPNKAVEVLVMTDVAALLVALHGVSVLESAESPTRTAMLAYYDDDPASSRYGTYVISQEDVTALGARYAPLMDERAERYLARILERTAPKRRVSTDEDLVACQNCIVSYSTGEVIPFSPEMVFTSKLAVRWDPKAENVFIPNPEGCIDPDHDGTDCDAACLMWDVESWMSDLSDDPEVVDLLWKTLGAVVRHKVRWNRMVWHFDERGNNGKGTHIGIGRSLLGPSSHVSISMADAGDRYGLSQIIDAGFPAAILTDENPVGSYVQSAAVMKSLISHESVPIQRKNLPTTTVQWRGMIVQCFNELPLTRDKTLSLERRVILVPWSKSFTDRERKYIKDDYLQRPEVLQYILRRVLDHDLTPEYHELPIPAVCAKLLNEFSEGNDPLKQFWTEMHYEVQWDFLPYSFLYDLYKAWMQRKHSTSKPLSIRKFESAFRALIDSAWASEWTYPRDEPMKRQRPGMRMSLPEPLIVEYNLEPWLNCKAPKNAPINVKACMDASQFKHSYPGVTRVHSAPGSVAARAAVGFIPEVNR